MVTQNLSASAVVTGGVSRGFLDSITSADKSLAGFSGTLGKVQLAAIATSAAIGGALLKSIGALRDRLSETDALLQSSQGLFSEADAQRYVVAANAVGLTAAQLGRVAARLNEVQQDLAHGITSEYAKDIEAYGLSLDIVSGGIEGFVAALQQMESQSAAAGLANSVLGARLGGVATELAFNERRLNSFNKAWREAEIVSASALDAQSNLDDSLAAIRERLLGVQVGLAQAVTPALTSLVEALTPVVSGFAEFVKQNPGLVKAITAVSFGLTGMIVTLQAARLAALAFGAASRAAFVGNPIGLAITGLVVGVTLLSNRFGGLGELWERVWNSMKLTALASIRVILTPLDLMIRAINLAIDGINRLNVFGGGIQRISSPAAAVDSAIADSAQQIFAPVTTNNNQRSQTNVYNINANLPSQDDYALGLAETIRRSPGAR